MQNTIRLHIKKDYAAALIQDLIKAEAVELVEEQTVELTEAQKKALDKELAEIAGDPSYAKRWNDVRHKYLKR